MTENNTNSKSENLKKIEAIIKQINIFKESSENEIRNLATQAKIIEFEKLNLIF